MSTPAHRLCAVLPLLFVLLVSPGCRIPRFTKEGADREVYGILEKARPCVAQVAGTVNVEAADRLAAAQRAEQAYTLTLDDALALGAVTSRDYLRQRENVYLEALALTGAANEFNPLFAAGAGGELLARDGTNAVGIGGSTLSGATDLSVSRAFQTGGGFVLAIAQDFLKNISTADPFSLARTILAADVILPLARGAGWVARENLIQSEHDTLYAMRDFARFQQEFTVEIATRYYRLLGLRNTWRNEELTFESLTRLLERQVSLGAQGAGRIPDFEVDQTRQDVLRADERRLVARIAYVAAVDDFKFLLGVPIETKIEIPPADLERLETEGLTAAPWRQAQEAVDLALARRLDLHNARGQEIDAWRKVLVAKNALGAQVDLRLGGALRTAETRPWEIEDSVVEGLLGLDIDLPLQRTAERNAFRAAMIQAARARRQRQGREDEVTLAVREAYRRLDRASQSFALQEASMKLAARRVESTTLLLEAGKASTRDRLDAENALVRARNGTTLALVDYASARLALLSDVGILAVGPDATWTPVPPAPDSPQGPVLDLPSAAPDPPTGPLPDPLSVEPESVPPASDG